MENIESLNKLIDKLEVFRGFNMEYKSNAIDKKTYQLYFQNLKNYRSIYLLEFADADTIGFFEIPDAIEILKSINHKTSRSSDYFSPMFIRNLATSIQRFYINPETLSKFVNVYFKMDKSNVLLFAYSTFPAIFGYFTTSEFCESASKFMINYFGYGDANVSVELLKSFFKSLPVFYEDFFYALSQDLKQSENYTELTVNAIKKSKPHVSKWHLNVFNEFLHKFSDEYIIFFLEFVILRPFLRVVPSSPYFVNRKNCLKYAEFIQQLIEREKNHERTKEGSMILVSFLSTSKYFDKDLSLPVNICKPPIPLILCPNDVKMIYDIIKSGNDKTFLFPKKAPDFKDSFDPFYLDVYPNIQKMSVPVLDESFFGMTPKLEKIESDYELEKVESYAIDESNDKGIDPRKVLSKMNISDELLVKLYHNIALSYETNLRNLSIAIEKEENCRKLISFTESIRASIFTLIQYRSIDLFGGISTNPDLMCNDIVKIIFSVCHYERNVDKELFFQLIITAFGSLNIELTDEGRALSELFVQVNEEYIAKNIIGDYDLEGLSKIMMNLNTLSTSSWSLGKFIKQLIAFEKQMSQLMKMKWAQRQKPGDVFAVSIATNMTNYFFTLFSLANEYIFKNAGVITQFPNQVVQSWLNINTLLWTLINGNKKLFEALQNKEIIKRSVFITKK